MDLGQDRILEGESYQRSTQQECCMDRIMGSLRENTWGSWRETGGNKSQFFGKETFKGE